MSQAKDIEQILPLRDRARVYNEILEWRLDNILPAIMREEGVDMWVVINFEYDEDPFNGWLVDGNPATDFGNDGVDNDNDGNV